MIGRHFLVHDTGNRGMFVFGSKFYSELQLSKLNFHIKSNVSRIVLFSIYKKVLVLGLQ